MRTPDAVSANRLRRILAIALAASFVVVAALVAAPRPAAAAGAAPWFSPNVRVNVPPAYTANQPSIAVTPDGTVYVAFAGWGGSSTQQDIFVSKSFDAGRTWSAPIKVNSDTGGATQADPALVADAAGILYLAWTDYRNGNADVYFAKSTDGALSFSANVRANDVTVSFQVEPTLGVDVLGLIHVAWTDNRNFGVTGPDIYYANSTDGGLSFNPNTRVNNDAGGGEQGRPAIAVAHDRSVYLAWADPRNPGRSLDIYFSKSTDLGRTWTPNIIVNDDATGSAQTDPAISANATGAVFVAWTDYRSPNTAPDIYATRSTNLGASFAGNVKVNDDAGLANQGSAAMTARSGDVVLAWGDGRTAGGTSNDIYWSSSADGLTWAANRKANDDAVPTSFQAAPSIAADSNGDVFAAWYDTRSSGQDVFAATLDVIAPAADAGAAPTVDQSASASFDGSASSDNLGIATYAWDFGDGTGANGASGSHAYAAPGTYTATLTVWDYSGNADSASVLVTVRDKQAPVIRGAGDRTIDEGAPLFFDASGSTDNVGVASWSWDFGDTSNATGATASHVYSTPGTYTATVTVSDAAGNTASTTMTITVRTVSPKASELLGMIQVLDVIVAILAVLLAIVGYMAYMLWRRSGGKPDSPYVLRATPPETPPKVQDPVDMPPPPAESPKTP